MTEPVESPLAIYRRHLGRGELAYQYDPVSGRAVFYPRVAEAGRSGLEWRISRGLGSVYATTAIGTRDGGEYNVALIDLDEGFRMMSRVEGLPANEVRIGTRVQVRMRASESDGVLPVFDPVAG
ncbi:Zn-ribbon domain-containing OB-fold protein [Variovorax sp. Sphag1AA]|uniref:Zn-ribbon domain-containing OB-fold protein n=1 Tax=Variovorax sp. Sphag1AA TaxID=2587027 RepID=UPI001612AFC3|nr:OB-fold domain-containing protein [Variovorax sp. Sphag1AA]MBB3178742.1 hypothetical protein [Variovorax sp. Sphag1AA]